MWSREEQTCDEQDKRLCSLANVRTNMKRTLSVSVEPVCSGATHLCDVSIFWWPYGCTERGGRRETGGSADHPKCVKKKTCKKKRGRSREASESLHAVIYRCKWRRLLLTALRILTLQKWRLACDWVTSKSEKIQSRWDKLLVNLTF